MKVVPIKAYTLVTKNYSYLVFDRETNEAVLVDPSGEYDSLESAIINHNVNVKGVLITHSHLDHITLVEPIAKKYGCPVIISSKEDLSYFASIKERLVFIDKDTTLLLSSLLVRAIGTPGHTIGSTCYLIGDNLFTGDTLFIEGCGMCFDEDGARRLFASLRHLKDLVTLNTMIYPGHSFGYEPGQRFKLLYSTNIYLQFDREEMFVSFRMRKGQVRIFDFR